MAHLAFSGFGGGDPFATDCSLDQLNDVDFQTLDLLGGFLDDPAFDFTLPVSAPVMLPAAPSNFKRSVEPVIKTERDLTEVKQIRSQDSLDEAFGLVLQPAWNQTSAQPLEAAMDFRISASASLDVKPTSLYGRSPSVSTPSSPSYYDEESDSCGDISSYSDTKTGPEDEVQVKKRGRKRKAIPEEERLAMNRQRNREHARCTRLRKRQQIDCLKQEVANLLLRRQELMQSDAALPMRAAASSPYVDVDECAGTITRLLELRFNGITDQQQWAAVTTSDFELHVPGGLLPGQDQLFGGPVGEVQADGMRVMRNLAEIAQDVIHLQQHVQCWQSAIQPAGSFSASAGLSLLPLLDSQTIIMTGDVFMCSWALNLQSFHNSQVVMDSMLECSFAPDGRIRKLVLMYDVLSVARQVQELRQARLQEQRLQELSRSTLLAAPSSPETISSLSAFGGVSMFAPQNFGALVPPIQV